jgi:hypothetical protein
VSEGIPTRKMAIRSGTVINRLWLFIFFVWHSGLRSISLIQVARMREAGILNQEPLGEALCRTSLPNDCERGNCYDR